MSAELHHDKTGDVLEIHFSLCYLKRPSLASIPFIVPLHSQCLVPFYLGGCVFAWLVQTRDQMILSSLLLLPLFIFQKLYNIGPFDTSGLSWDS